MCPLGDVMAALGRQPRCLQSTGIWTPRIAKQAWLADGAVGAAWEGRAESEHSSTFSCCSCHVTSVAVLQTKYQKPRTALVLKN